VNPCRTITAERGWVVADARTIIEWPDANVTTPLTAGHAVRDGATAAVATLAAGAVAAAEALGRVATGAGPGLTEQAPTRSTSPAAQAATRPLRFFHLSIAGVLSPISNPESNRQ